MALYKRYSAQWPCLPASILATRTSGADPHAIWSRGWKAPRVFRRHPFNPPHLIPLVDWSWVPRGIHRSGSGAIGAHAFYAHIVKHPIMLRKEGALAISPNPAQAPRSGARPSTVLQDGTRRCRPYRCGRFRPGARPCATRALYPGTHMTLSMAAGRGEVSAPRVEAFRPRLRGLGGRLMQRTPVFDDALKESPLDRRRRRADGGCASMVRAFEAETRRRG